MSLSLKYKKEYLQTLKKEIKQRNGYLNEKKIETVYFGGGTPSLLNYKEINEIIETVFKNFNIAENPEITLETNPDDINRQYVEKLKKTPVNRISLGIQSFFDDDLKLMNRRHDAEESKKSVKILQDAGYENISGDLIYGLPDMTLEKWKKNLDIFFDMNIPHLSAYHLTFEPGTVFYKYLKTGKLKEKEEESLKQFEILIKKAEKNRFLHYETSNFAKKGYFSRHNSCYWQQKHYLGTGAGAHSYNGTSRQHNVENIKKYITGVNEGKKYFEKEILTDTDKYNDYLITSLRTMWGTDISYISVNFGKKYAGFIKEKSKKHIESKHLKKEKNTLFITEKGKFIEDTIIKDLFYV